MSLVILICDDEPVARRNLEELFGDSHEVISCADGKEALTVLEKKEVDLVITDHQMPGLTGLELIKKAKPAYPRTSFILMTAFGSVDQAVEALQAGADDYILKPFEIVDMEHRVQRVQQFRRMESEQTLRQSDRAGSKSGANRLIGESAMIKRAREFISQVADVPSSILLLGPSGAGKEVMARAIHESGEKKNAPFVSVNCASLGGNLLESELFGHEKGAFTGATASKVGKFELAKGGTIFLDEIGELPIEVQAKLLRVLQEKEFYRVGGTRILKTDARLIAATNRDLVGMIKQGQFREDLYFRLNVISFELEALNSRPEDLPYLIQLFFDKFCQEFGKKITLGDDVRQALLSYSFPGNVRELQNIIERMVVLTQDRQAVSGQLMPKEIFTKSESPVDHNLKANDGRGLDEVLEELEKSMILTAMQTAKGNQVKAAEALKLTRGALQYKLKKYNYEPGSSAA
jgi:DNA-binding NtrC family response regulator